MHNHAALALAVILSACGPLPEDDVADAADEVTPHSDDSEDVAVPTRFPIRPRGTLQPVGVSVTTARVATASEFLNAVGNCAARGRGVSQSPFGSVIEIVAPLRFGSAVIIPRECAGLTIRSNGRHTISASGVVDALFKVRAANVEITGLFVDGTDDERFGMFVSVDEGAGAGNDIIVTDNYVVVDRLYVESVGLQPQSPLIMGNTFTRAASAPVGSTVELEGSNGRVVANYLSSGGTYAVHLGSSSLGVVVMGNTVSLGDIDVGNGSGFSSVTGNTFCGTITVGGSDAQAGNT